MSDVELLNFRDRGDRSHVFRTQSMAGVHGHSETSGQSCRIPELGGTRLVSRGERIAACMKLNGLYAEFARKLHDFGFWIDEKTHSNACVLQPFYGFTHMLSRSGNIQTALGCDFLASLRDKSDLVRAYPLCDC